MIAAEPRAADLPSRTAPRGSGPLELLWDVAPEPTGDVLPVRSLTAELALAYGGPLAIPLRPDRPTIVANFVESLDGVAALDAEGASGGGEVSGFSPADRFVMGLLRALADVVIVGSGTVRASDRGQWTPEAVSPPHASAFLGLRRDLGLARTPTTLIATAHGRIDPAHRVFADPASPVVIAAPLAVIDRLRGAGLAPHVRLEPLAGLPTGGALVEVAQRLGARVALSEGGPHLIGSLVADRLVDELFLTLAPQLAGRAPDAPRLGLIEGTPLWPVQPTWLDLASVRRADGHLFLRYVFEETR